MLDGVGPSYYPTFVYPRGDQDSPVQTLLARPEPFEAVERGQSRQRIIEGEQLAMNNVSSNRVSIGDGEALSLGVGGVICGAGGEDALLGRHQGREAEWEIVESAADFGFPDAEYAPAETVVVALAPLEGAVHKDFHYRPTRRA